MKKLIPESNKLIVLKCDDFLGDYEVRGMFIDYKKPIKKVKKYLNRGFVLTMKKLKCGNQLKKSLITVILRSI